MAAGGLNRASCVLLDLGPHVYGPAEAELWPAGSGLRSAAGPPGPPHPSHSQPLLEADCPGVSGSPLPDSLPAHRIPNFDSKKSSLSPHPMPAATFFFFFLIKKEPCMPYSFVDGGTIRWGELRKPEAK